MSRIITPCDETGHDYKGDNCRLKLELEQQSDGTWWQVKEPVCKTCGKGMGIHFPVKQVRKFDGDFSIAKILSGK